MKREDAHKKLTPRREKFCLKYVECDNASEAYRCSYSCTRMAERHVWEEASKLLKIPHVAQRVAELRAAAEKRAELKIDAVISMLSDAIMADVTDYVSPDGIIRTMDIKRMPKEARRLIQSVKATKDTVQIELIDKMSAIDRVAKILGWNAAEKHQHSFDPSKPFEIKFGE